MFLKPQTPGQISLPFLRTETTEVGSQTATKQGSWFNKASAKFIITTPNLLLICFILFGYTCILLFLDHL